MFSSEGKIVAMHSSWDPDTGARLGVNLKNLSNFVSGATASSIRSKRTKRDTMSSCYLINSDDK